MNACTILRGHAILNIEEFKLYLQKRKQVINAKPPARKNQTGNAGLAKTDLCKLAISDNNLEALKQMMKVLHLKAYSRNAMLLYTKEMTILLKLLGIKA